MKNQATRERFVELRAEGISYQSIAAQLGVSRNTLIAWAQELKHELANARSIRRDELLQRYALAAEGRLKAFGQQFQNIMGELGKRNLEDVPTAALLALALKWGQYLQTEAAPAVLVGTEATPDWSPVMTWPA